MPRDYEKEKRLLANLDALLLDGKTDAFTSSKSQNDTKKKKTPQPSFAAQQPPPSKSKSKLPGVTFESKPSDVEAKKRMYNRR
mmetsp:Transcript_34115/g.49507  ORF Transcript_34115/g.49507 Transcript_34115/m.49507 type:complete len:83 (+) Transcript_34115:116-364(+)